MLSVSIDSRGLRALDKIEQDLQLAVTRALMQTSLLVNGAIKQQLVVETADGNPRGQLLGTWRAELLKTEEDEFIARAASDSKYARIQNEGGRIQPKRAKFLTVPLPGTPYGAQARDFPDLQFIPIKGRSPVLAQIQPRKNGPPKVRVLFVLKRFVNLPAKRYVDKAVEGLGEKPAELFEKAIKEATGA